MGKPFGLNLFSQLPCIKSLFPTWLQVVDDKTAPYIRRFESPIFNFYHIQIDSSKLFV